MRQHTIDLNINFPNPLRIVVEIHSDKAEQQRLADSLRAARVPLEEALEAQSPTTPTQP